MPSETILIIIVFLLYTSLREFLHYKQTVRLQELLKSIDITEYYKAIHKDTKKVSPSGNTIMDEPNEIAIDDPRWDISKINSIIVDGEEKPVNII